MKKRFNGTYFYTKDIGKIRLTNEDECKILVNSQGDILLMVADGMGGHLKGDFASHEVINYIKDEFVLKNRFFSTFSIIHWLKKTINKVNLSIYNKSDNNLKFKGMGTTLLLAVIHKDKMIVVNSGDSRCYALKNYTLRRYSEDQTYVNYLYKSGKITKEEVASHPKRHILTNAVGLYPSCSLDIKVFDYDGEEILLCSDGLYNNVTEKDIEDVLKTNQSSEQKVMTLLNLANFNGGTDNISLALWEIIK